MTIEQRLEKLERTVRRYQLAFGILGLALLATTAIACSQQALAAQKNAAIPEVIRARKFEVVARNGTPVVQINTMKVAKTGREYGIIAGRSDQRIRIGACGPNDNGGGLLILDDGISTNIDSTSVYMTADPRVGGVAIMDNALEKQVVYIGSGKTNTGIITLSDANGKTGRVLSGSP